MPAGRLNVFSFGRIVMRRFVEDRCMQIASSLTFTSLLSIVPFVTIALTMIAAFPVFGELTGALQTFILHNMVPASAGVIANYTEQFSAQAAKLTAVGIGFLGRDSTHDAAHYRKRLQRYLAREAPASGSAACFRVLDAHHDGTGADRSEPLAHVMARRTSRRSRAWSARCRGSRSDRCSILLTGVALTLLYVAMPNRRIAVRDAVIGGLLAAVVFEGMKRGFAVYLAKVPTYTLVYGAFATLPIFLMWIYLSWLVVVFGAVVVAALPEWRSGAGQSEPVPGSDFFDALQILHILWRAHRTGVSVKLPELFAAVTARIERVERILEIVTSAGWVTRTVPAGWYSIAIPPRSRSRMCTDCSYFAARHHPGPRLPTPISSTLVHELGIPVARLSTMRMPLELGSSAAASTERRSRRSNSRRRSAHAAHDCAE